MKRAYVEFRVQQLTEDWFDDLQFIVDDPNRTNLEKLLAKRMIEQGRVTNKMVSALTNSRVVIDDDPFEQAVDDAVDSPSYRISGTLGGHRSCRSESSVVIPLRRSFFRMRSYWMAPQGSRLTVLAFSGLVVVTWFAGRFTYDLW